VPTRVAGEIVAAKASPTRRPDPLAARGEGEAARHRGAVIHLNARLRGLVLERKRLAPSTSAARDEIAGRAHDRPGENARRVGRGPPVRWRAEGPVPAQPDGCPFSARSADLTT
jgi:hypothetical protein